jgi:hypothetical protein
MIRRKIRICILTTGVSLLWLASSLPIPMHAEPPQSAMSGKVDFSRDIQPILEKSCYGCHGAKMQMGGLRLDSKKLALDGGQSGKAIIPGKQPTVISTSE